MRRAASPLAANWSLLLSRVTATFHADLKPESVEWLIDGKPIDRALGDQVVKVELEELPVKEGEEGKPDTPTHIAKLVLKGKVSGKITCRVKGEVITPSRKGPKKEPKTIESTAFIDFESESREAPRHPASHSASPPRPTCLRREQALRSSPPHSRR